MKDKIIALLLVNSFEEVPDRLVALFASELADYKELLEKQRELILKLDAFNQASNCDKIRIYRTSELRQRITELETKIKSTVAESVKQEIILSNNNPCR